MPDQLATGGLMACNSVRTWHQWHGWIILMSHLQTYIKMAGNKVRTKLASCTLELLPARAINVVTTILLVPRIGLVATQHFDLDYMYTVTMVHTRCFIRPAT
jgi:hypothetical protein